MVTVGKKIVAAIGTAAIMRTTAVIKTTIAMIKAFKVFKKEAIILIGEKTVIMVVKTSRRDIAASFDKREKYI